MKYFITSIYDHIAKAYTSPAYSPNTAIAVRAFANAANDRAHAIGMNPGDYSMFVLGEFDDDTAELKIFATPQSIGLAASYVKVRMPSGPDHDRSPNFQKEKALVQHEITPQSQRHAAQLQQGPSGGNSSQQLRPEPRSQDDVRRGVADTDTH